MYRTFVILRHTFVDAIVQPIYPLLLALGSAVLIVFGLLPFFTLGEDTTMYKSVGLDVVLLLVLVSTLFATSKSVFEEIEDRTMLTLMSKPVQRWEVLLGKYLGIILAALLAVAIFGAILILCTVWRIPSDYQLRTFTLDDRELQEISDLQWMHVMGLIPCLVLVWLQVSVLAAIGVALSTRFSLVVNLPTVILIYIAGNLTRFLYPFTAETTTLHKGVASAASLLLPYLATFDLRGPTIYHDVALAGTVFAKSASAVKLSAIWSYIAIAAGYGIAYATFALSCGMWLFQRRELGGNEG
ncbi:MAG TPA: ABC transporter permease [Tepidisphaeraceae bacterium]|jgi:ABC-type transport system involved in multi-copper enzyme maturation permease subunit|nr:ABC transporter permease [Tepidisphaeraceae bacterium]